VSQEDVCISTFCCHDGNQLAARWCHWTQAALWPPVMINSSYRASTPLGFLLSWRLLCLCLSSHCSRLNNDTKRPELCLSLSDHCSRLNNDTKRLKLCNGPWKLVPFMWQNSMLNSTFLIQSALRRQTGGKEHSVQWTKWRGAELQTDQ